MNNNLISVIIPVYNVKKYLSECIKSVISQTYHNLQILLIDDCSNDGSEKLCDFYSQVDSRINVYHCKNRGGVSQARNIGLKLSIGRYITFVDSDDYIHFDMYSKMVAAMEKYDADCVICGYDKFSDEGVLDNNKLFVTSCLSSDEAIVNCVKNYGLTVWNKIFKIDKIKSKNETIEFSDKFIIGEDMNWLIRVIQSCKIISCIDFVGYHYRVRAGSAVFLSYGEKIFESCYSRGKAAYETYCLLKDKYYAWMFYKRYLFSIKDLMCAAYCTDSIKILNENRALLKDGIRKYRRFRLPFKERAFISKCRILIFISKYPKFKPILKVINKKM